MPFFDDPIITLFGLFFLLCTIIFGFYLACRPTSLWTGFWGIVFIADCSFIIILTLYKISSTLMYVVSIPILAALALLTLSSQISIIFLLLNERILIKKEGKSLGNFLPAIIAVLLILFEVGFFIVNRFFSNSLLFNFFTFFNSCLTYFVVIFFMYSLTALLYKLVPIRSKVDYIIVLGSGLSGDKVTPLLAGRIEAGIALYNKQAEKLNHHPTIILSGGQGADEKIPEAHAMYNYIKEKGYHIDTLYIEDKSTSTYENITFSEQLAVANDGIENFQHQTIAIATSSYHLLRAGKIAKKLGIRARGAGAKTKGYYIPAAFIREYIGYLEMTKTRHLVFVALSFTFTVLLEIVARIISQMMGAS